MSQVPQGLSYQNTESSYQNSDGWQVEGDLGWRRDATTGIGDDWTPAFEDAVEGAGHHTEPTQSTLKENDDEKFIQKTSEHSKSFHV